MRLGARRRGWRAAGASRLVRTQQTPHLLASSWMFHMLSVLLYHGSMNHQLKKLNQNRVNFNYINFNFHHNHVYKRGYNKP